MIVTEIDMLLARRAEKRLAEKIAAPLRALSAQEDCTGDAFQQFSVNPRLRGGVLRPEEVLWPLKILSMPKVESFEEVSARASELRANVDHAAKQDPPILSDSEKQAARVNITKAVTFLQWPQNRERVAGLLQSAPEPRPPVTSSADSELLPLFDRGLRLLRRAIVWVQTLEARSE